MLVGGMLLIMTTLEKVDEDVEEAWVLICFMLLPLPLPLHVRLCVSSSSPLAVGISIGLNVL
jgi:hypothetical protein